MTIKPLVQELWGRKDCRFDSSGDVAPSSYPLPDDLAEFYRFCGGATLFIRTPREIRLSGPLELVPTDPQIYGRLSPRSLTASWHVIARRRSDAFLSIDLGAPQFGHCYDSAWDRHGVPGNCPIVARSFSELLENLVVREGEPWWLDPSWMPLGDALPLADLYGR